MEDTVVVTIPETEADEVAVTGNKVISDSPQDGIEDLKRQLAEARVHAERQTAVAEEEGRRRTEAERAAREYAGQATINAAAAYEREYESLLNAISSTQQQIESQRAAYRAAMEEGDYDKASEINVKLGRMASRLENMESGKNAVEEARKAPQPGQVERQAPQPVDWNRAWTPQEAETVLRGYTPKTAAWIRAHPQFVNDPGFRQQVGGADSIARGRGIAPDTDEYFSFVERTIGIGSNEGEREQERAAAASAAPPMKSQITPSAPPSRQASGVSSQSPRPGRTVELSREEREMAQMLFPKALASDPDPEVAYARYKLQAQADGAYERLNGAR